MRVFILILFLSFFSGSCFGQKPFIDSSVYARWPQLGLNYLGNGISNDGNYCIYTTYFVKYLHALDRKWVVKSTHGSWEKIIPDALNSMFSSDSRLVIFRNSGDSLGIITLGTSSVEYIPRVRSFTLQAKDSSEWLVYLSDSSDRSLVIRDLLTGQQQTFYSVTDYQFSGDGRMLLLEVSAIKDSASTRSVDLISLTEGRRRSIWKGIGNASNFVFGERNADVAFTVTTNQSNGTCHSFWYFKRAFDKANLLIDDHFPGVDSGLVLDYIIDFSSDNNRLFISLKEVDPPKPKKDAVKVNVWSYTDARLQSEQLQELVPRSYTAVLTLDRPRIIRLERDKNDWIVSPVPPRAYTDHILILNMKGTGDEWNWNPAAQPIAYLISTKDGSRKQVIHRGITQPVSACDFSPAGKYIIYYDVKQKNYFSYTVSSGIFRNITHGIMAEWTPKEDEVPGSVYWPRAPIVAWTKGDASLMLYDQYDLWQIDPAGVNPPLNLTNGYGRRHGIVLRLTISSPVVLNGNETLLLKAFNDRTKDNGFFQKRINEIGDPELLTMGRYSYDSPPVKGRDTEVYLVNRMSATEHPNIFMTNDFKKFTPITSIYPERSYNWLTSELITWKTFNGSLSQGVLYKPENFDPKKKYPIIFLYYERLSDELNLYRSPETSDGRIDIPTFVSNGYLVFTPDIHYSVGEVGESVVNAVVSAAEYLSRLPWVDGKRMGINGHSFGGYETDYLVTHTHLFAAAVSGSGFSDLISDYGGLWSIGHGKEEYYELRAFRMGASLWQRPDFYIKNSPIFKANQVTTPLLLMDNTLDYAVPFSQGVEFFTALRRVGKRAWMLQYDEMGHHAIGKEGTDYQIRITQFFDHYLKGAPAPRWMTQGIPASMKGLDNGFELDTRPGIEP